VKSLSTVLVSAALGASMLAFSSLSAAAAIASSSNVCWHSHERLDYPPKAHITIHEDNWRWGPNEHYSFREHLNRVLIGPITVACAMRPPRAAALHGTCGAAHRPALRSQR